MSVLGMIPQHITFCYCLRVCPCFIMTSSDCTCLLYIMYIMDNYIEWNIRSEILNQMETFFALLALCGSGPQWIPLKKASDAVLWCFLWSVPEQMLKQNNQNAAGWFETPSRSLWHCNVWHHLRITELRIVDIVCGKVFLQIHVKEFYLMVCIIYHIIYVPIHMYPRMYLIS